jgi:hypothetical protein
LFGFAGLDADLKSTEILALEFSPVVNRRDCANLPFSIGRTLHLGAGSSGSSRATSAPEIRRWAYCVASLQFALASLPCSGFALAEALVANSLDCAEGKAGLRLMPMLPLHPQQSFSGASFYSDVSGYGRGRH